MVMIASLYSAQGRDRHEASGAHEENQAVDRRDRLQVVNVVGDHIGLVLVDRNQRVLDRKVGSLT